MSLRNLVSVTTAIVLSIFAVPSVFAHGDEPRIEVSADRLNPGDTLDIRGADFEFEEAVVLDLVSPQGEIPFGTVLADVEGIFLLTITLPFDIAEGTYVIRATTDDHVVESVPITIWGTADLGSGEQGPRQEEDGLLAPMPTNLPVISTTPVRAPAPGQTAAQMNIGRLIVWIAAAMGILITMSLWLRRSRP